MRAAQTLILLLLALASPAARAQFGFPPVSTTQFKIAGTTQTPQPAYVNFSTGLAGSLSGGVLTVTSTGTGGTVTSVGLTMPADYSVANSPITGSGTLAVTYATQTANKVFASAVSGGAATPAFRALVNADFPTSGVSANTYTYATVAVNAQGIVTSASNGTTPAPGFGTSTITGATLQTAASGAQTIKTVTPASGGTTVFNFVMTMWDITNTLGASWQTSCTWRSNGTATQIGTTTAIWTQNETAAAAPTCVASSGNVLIQVNRSSNATTNWVLSTIAVNVAGP